MTQEREIDIVSAIGFGIIGCGKMGDVHARHTNAHPRAQVVAATDVCEERARALAGKHNALASYSDADGLLDDPRVRAVIIAMPTAPRKDIALRAFAKGKHVLTEKPVAMCAAEVREMIAARGDLVAACCSQRWRHMKSSRLAAEVIAAGTLGRIRSMHLRCIIAAKPRPVSPPPSWRLSRAANGGGILMNRGCYDLDYLFGITGWTLEPRTVLAQTWTVPGAFAAHVAQGSDAETHVVAFIRCAGGETIHLERAEYIAATSSSAIKIVGDRASLHLGTVFAQGKDGKQVVLDRADAEKGVVSETVWAGEDAPDYKHTAPLDDFVRAIEDKRPCATSLENALVVQQVTDAIYASAESGEPTRLDA